MGSGWIDYSLIHADDVVLFFLFVDAAAVILDGDVFDGGESFFAEFGDGGFSSWLGHYQNVACDRCHRRRKKTAMSSESEITKHRCHRKKMKKRHSLLERNVVILRVANFGIFDTKAV